jgi:hypothetical protein
MRRLAQTLTLAGVLALPPIAACQPIHLGSGTAAPATATAAQPPPTELAPDYFDSYPNLEDDTALAPDPRSNGRWMIFAVIADRFTTPGKPTYWASCWKNSNLANLRPIQLTKRQYDRYLDHPDPRALPCPA